MISSLFDLPWQECLRRLGATSAAVSFSGRVHLVTKNLFPFDAISRFIMEIAFLLRAKGINCLLYMQQCPEIDRAALHHVSELPSMVDPGRDVLLYHYSIGDSYLEMLSSLPIRKLAYYHGITPPNLLTEFAKEVAAECEQGRNAAAGLLAFDALVFSSKYLRRELLECCRDQLKKSITLDVSTFLSPPFLSLSKLDSVEPDYHGVESFADGSDNLLYVGRQYPHKRVEDVLQVFKVYHEIRPDSRLILAGSEHVSSYRRYLQEVVLDLGDAGKKVEFVDNPSDAKLRACYKIAHAVICMSEHEGFGIPLVEAMKFGVPIVAYDAAAVEETLSGAGLLFKTKDYKIIAREMAMLQSDPARRKAVVSAQEDVYARRYRDDLNVEHFLQALTYVAGLSGNERRNSS